MLLSIRDLRRLHLAASFDLDAGECVAVRGPSGSGKTQLWFCQISRQVAAGQQFWLRGAGYD